MAANSIITNHCPIKKVSSFIFLAPHLEIPPRNGGDIYVERLAYHLSQKRDIILLAKDKKIFYRNGNVHSQINFENEFRSRTAAAVRTILLRSHYLGERFLTNEYKKQAQALINENSSSTIIFSSISANKLINRQHQKKIITFTQNDEIVWFQNQRKFTNNPLHKWVALQSEMWVKSFFKYQQKDILFAHICQSDFDGYQKLSPEHLGIIVPAGVDIYPLENSHQFDGILRLLFVGSLSVKMNYDALIFFNKHFWNYLKNMFRSKIEFMVAGSNPSSSVQELANREQWPLFANLDDTELRALYQKANFAVLPFPYTTGAKLKLLNSMVHGLPVLGTKNMLSLPQQDFSPNYYSDSPTDWSKHLSKFISAGVSESDKKKCQDYASQFSWGKIIEEFEEQLKSSGI